MIYQLGKVQERLKRELTRPERDVAGVQLAICAERLRDVMCDERGKRESETRERERRKEYLLLPVCLFQSDKFHTLSSALSRTSEREPHLEAKDPQQRHLLDHVGNKLRTTRRSRGGAARGGGTPSSTSKAPGSSGRRRTFLHEDTCLVRTGEWKTTCKEAGNRQHRECNWALQPPSHNCISFSALLHKRQQVHAELRACLDLFLVRFTEIVVPI